MSALQSLLPHIELISYPTLIPLASQLSFHHTNQQSTTQPF
jgi:hypothetical protein